MRKVLVPSSFSFYYLLYISIFNHRIVTVIDNLYIMANKYFYTYIHDGKNNSLLPEEVATTYWNSLIFDVNHRTIWHQGMPFGNVYPGTTSYGEVFNSIDFNVAKSAYSHAEGWKTIATFADNDSAYGSGAHAEGANTIAYNVASHAEGYGSIAYDKAHAEGVHTFSYKEGGHAEGSYTYSLGYGAHTEGSYTMAFGIGSHAEGGTSKFIINNNGKTDVVTYSNQTLSIGNYSHAEGTSTHSIGESSHVEGILSVTTSLAKGAHAEGISNISNAISSHTEGSYTIAEGESSHAEGSYTSTSEYAKAAHSEGIYTNCKGIASHAENYNTYANGNSSHAENYNTYANGNYSHAEGYNTYAIGISSHTEGYQNIAYGNYQHLEGKQNIGYGNYSHIEGTNNQENGIGTNHIHGNSNIIDGNLLNVQGNYNINVQGTNSTVIGTYNNVYTNNSFIIGNYTYIPKENNVILNNVFVLGNNLTPTNDSEIIIGNYAKSYENGISPDHTIFSIGYGTNIIGNQNAFDIRKSGTSYLYNISYTWDNGDEEYKETFPEGLYPIATTSYVMYHGVGKRNWSKDKNGNLLYTYAEYFNDYVNNKAVANYAHAEGTNTYAAGISSHAEGKYTETYNEAEHASGKYNKSYNGQNNLYTLFTIGNGINTINRKNVFSILDTNLGMAPNGIAFIENNPIITNLIGDTYNTTSRATYIWTGKYSEYNNLQQYEADALYFVEDGDGSSRNDFITYDNIKTIFDNYKEELINTTLNGLVRNASILSNSNINELQIIGNKCAGTSAITTYIWTGSKTDYESIKDTVDKVLSDNTHSAYNIVKHMQFIIHPDE